MINHGHVSCLFCLAVARAWPGHAQCTKARKLLKINSQRMTNLKVLDVSGNEICTYRLLDLLRGDNFVSARKGEFDHNWSGNALDEEGKGGRLAGTRVRVLR